MTYEQSFRNIEKLKNWVIPLDAHRVFFDFSNNSDFKIIFYKKTEPEKIRDFISTKFRSKLPSANIVFNELDHEIFHYEDKNIRYEYNLTTQEMLMHDSKEPFRNYSPAQLAIEMNKLLLKLKNM